MRAGHSTRSRVLRGALAAWHRARIGWAVRRSGLDARDRGRNVGRHSLALTGLAGVFGQGGQPAEALSLHRELIDRAPRRYVSPTHLALMAEAAGQHEEGISFARRAWDEREPSFILWARHFPQYRSLHPDPRFAAILREMDSPAATDEELKDHP